MEGIWAIYPVTVLQSYMDTGLQSYRVTSLLLLYSPYILSP